MKAHLLMPLLFAVFSVLFFVIGALIQADIIEAVYILCFASAAVSAFCVRVSPLFDQKERYRRINGSSFIVSAVFCLILSLAIFSFIFDGYRFPIFSDNIEYDRMFAVIEWGAVYRIANQTLYVMAALLGFSFIKGRNITKIVSIFLLFAGFTLVFALGFRSRLLDFFLIYVVGVVVAKMMGPTPTMIGSTPTLRARGLIPILLGGTVLCVLAFVGILHVTAVREDVTHAEAFVSVIDRTFLLNYRVNFWRVYSFVEHQGILWGQTYLQDPASLILPESISSQEMITRHFNQVNSQVFTMTPTVFGEAYINFGWASAIVIPAVIVVHRVLFEYLILYIRRAFFAPIFYALLVVYIYAVPRITVTGGVSQAFFLNLVIFIIIALLLSFPFMLARSLKKVSATHAHDSSNY